MSFARNLQHDPPTRDELDDLKRQDFRKYVSPWKSIGPGESFDFRHGLPNFPSVASVLEADDSQGTGQSDSSSSTVTKTVTLIRVANTGSAVRFFRVRAF